jgi:hypothetical protein
MDSSWRSLYFVFTGAFPGREREFEQWYTSTHIPDVFQHPHVAAATQYKVLTDATGVFSRHLTVYELTGDDPNAVVEALFKLDYRRSSAIDRSKAKRITALQSAPRRLRDGVAPPGEQAFQAAPGMLLAFNQSFPGGEAAFEDWYTGTHMPEAMRHPKTRAATRFRVVNDPLGVVPANVAVYEVDSDDPEAVSAEMRGGTYTPADPDYDRAASRQMLARQFAPRLVRPRVTL